MRSARLILVLAVTLVTLTPCFPCDAGKAVTLDGLSWRLCPELQGFAVAREDSTDPGRAWTVSSVHENQRNLVTISIARRARSTTASELRQQGWEQLDAIPDPYEPVDVRFWEDGTKVCIEYFIELPAEGSPIHRKNLFCYAFRDGVAVSAHASSGFFEPDRDRPWMDALMASFEPVPRN